MILSKFSLFDDSLKILLNLLIRFLKVRDGRQESIFVSNFGTRPEISGKSLDRSQCSSGTHFIDPENMRGKDDLDGK